MPLRGKAGTEYPITAGNPICQHDKPDISCYRLHYMYTIYRIHTCLQYTFLAIYSEFQQ